MIGTHVLAGNSIENLDATYRFFPIKFSQIQDKRKCHAIQCERCVSDASTIADPL